MSQVELYANGCDLTFEGLREAEANGEPTPDLVLWGETMFGFGV